MKYQQQSSFCYSVILLKGSSVFLKVKKNYITSLTGLSVTEASNKCLQCESKKSPLRFSYIFPKRLGIFNQFFTHLLYVPIYARLQIWNFYSNISNCDEVMPYWVQLPSGFLHFPRPLTSKFIYWANDVTVDVMSYPSCLLTLKSVCKLLINFYEWVKYPTTNCAKDQCPPNSPDLKPLDYHVRCAMLQAFHKFQSKPKTIPELKSALQQIWDDLPQTMINKDINDFRKHWNVWTHAFWPTVDNIIEHMMSSAGTASWA